MLFPVLPLALHLGLVGVRAQTYSVTYSPTNLPDKSETGQSGTDQCSNTYNQTSECQTAWVNSLTDWCIWGPPDAGANSVIGNTERIEVAWCTQANHGTRVIPNGAITGAHFVQTPNYVQLTGIGDLTQINIPAGDAGGELDPHGADGNGNPIGSLVFTTAFTGQPEQAHEWTDFVSATQFCFRVCHDSAQAPALCNHIYDTMGCAWNMPGDYTAGFTSCRGDDDLPMGVYGTSTFFQGQPSTPAAHPAAATSSCTTISSISNSVSIAIATNTSSVAKSTATATGAGASKTSSGAAASGTSKSNAAPALRLPSGGSLVSMLGIVLGAFMF